MTLIINTYYFILRVKFIIVEGDLIDRLLFNQKKLQTKKVLSI